MFELAMPWVLVLIILPLLIWILLPPATPVTPAALKVPFYNALLPVINKEQYRLAKPRQAWVFFIIWSLLLFALAGPRWVGAPLPLQREGRNIMLVLDLSGSMEMNDMLLNGQPVSRLLVVKRAAKEFVQERRSDRIGLILFGSQAYLQTPLTFDRHSVLMRIDDATVGLAGKTTSIGDALGLAVKRLQNVPKSSRVVILLTDGVNNSGVLTPLKAAELAKDDGIKVYTIGLGSEVDPRAFNDSLFNLNAAADLDEETLKKVAKLTGGQYFRATDTQSLQAIYGTINQLETVSQEEQTIRPEKEYYPWPLGLAFLLLLLWMGKKTRLLTGVWAAWSRRSAVS
ncbi:MAG: VWA domain-containing protein [Legionella sp.]|nr:VWA domain-containing protein [Legionella sp.]